MRFLFRGYIGDVVLMFKVIKWVWIVWSFCYVFIGFIILVRVRERGYGKIGVMGVYLEG